MAQPGGQPPKMTPLRLPPIPSASTASISEPPPSTGGNEAPPAQPSPLANMKSQKLLPPPLAVAGSAQRGRSRGSGSARAAAHVTSTRELSPPPPQHARRIESFSNLSSVPPQSLEAGEAPSDAIAALRPAQLISPPPPPPLLLEVFSLLLKPPAVVPEMPAGASPSPRATARIAKASLPSLI